MSCELARVGRRLSIVTRHAPYRPLPRMCASAPSSPRAWCPFGRPFRVSSGRIPPCRSLRSSPSSGFPLGQWLATCHFFRPTLHAHPLPFSAVTPGPRFNNFHEVNLQAAPGIGGVVSCNRTSCDALSSLPIDILLFTPSDISVPCAVQESCSIMQEPAAVYPGHPTRQLGLRFCDIPFRFVCRLSFHLAWVRFAARHTAHLRNPILK